MYIALNVRFAQMFLPVPTLFLYIPIDTHIDARVFYMKQVGTVGTPHTYAHFN